MLSYAYRFRKFLPAGNSQWAGRNSCAACAGTARTNLLRRTDIQHDPCSTGGRRFGSCRAGSGGPAGCASGGRVLVGVWLFLVTVFMVAEQPASADDAVASLLSEVDDTGVTDVDYHIEISGKIITPSADGDREFALKSTGEFRLRNHPFPSDAGGPFSLPYPD